MAQTPKFKQGDDYGSIRVKLLQQGRKPLILPDSDECMEGDTRCQGRPEMQWCSGTGLAGCEFNWMKKGKRLSICTMGEEKPSFRSYCR